MAQRVGQGLDPGFSGAGSGYHEAGRVAHGLGHEAKRLLGCRVGPVDVVKHGYYRRGGCGSGEGIGHRGQALEPSQVGGFGTRAAVRVEQRTRSERCVAGKLTEDLPPGPQRRSGELLP